MKKIITCAGLVFLGGYATVKLLSIGFEDKTKNIREGSVLYDDDKIKVIDMSNQPRKNVTVATVLFKNQTANEES